MKHATLLPALFAALALAGCGQKSDEEPKYESPTAKLDRWRNEARAGVLEAVSNEVTGFIRLRSDHLMDESPRPGEWEGWAEAERTNARGGVERVNCTLGCFVHAPAADGRSHISVIAVEWPAGDDEFRGWRMRRITEHQAKRSPPTATAPR